MQCARVFSTCLMRAGLFCFSEGMGEILVYLGFLQVLNLVCKLGCADLQPSSCHPGLSFHTLQVHHPPLVLSFLKTSGNFSVLVLGLLWDCSQCDTFNNQIIKVKSSPCKEGTKEGSWQLTSLTVFLG